QAVAVEAMYGRTIMASFHGLWSLAGFTGAAIGAAMAAMHIGPFQHFLLITVMAVAIVACSMKHVVQQDVNAQEGPQPLFARPDRFLLTLGMIAFCSMICEGTMFDWSGVYFKKVVQARDGMAG